MRKTIVLLYCIFHSCASFASGMRSDILIWKGDTLRLLTKPLDSFPQGDSLTTNILSHLYKKDQILHPERYKEGGDGGSWLSSICMGEYEAEWHLIENKLYLVNVYKCADRSVKADIKELFPDEVVNNQMQASWFNGVLEVGIGELLKEHRYIFEMEQVFTFVDGQLKDTQVYTNWVKKSSFKPLNEPDEWEEFIYNNLDWKKLPKLGNKALSLGIDFEINEEGKINKIIDTSADCFVIKKRASGSSSKLAEDSQEIKELKKGYIQEAIKIAYLVPQWDVVYQQGKINKRSYGFIITERIRRKYAR